MYIYQSQKKCTLLPPAIHMICTYICREGYSSSLMPWTELLRMVKLKCSSIVSPLISSLNLDQTSLEQTTQESTIYLKWNLTLASECSAYRTTMVQTVPHFALQWKACTTVTIKDNLCACKKIELHPPIAPDVFLATTIYSTVVNVCWDVT